MTQYETVWTFKTDRFTIECAVAPETIPPEDCFEFDEDINAIRNGSCEWFIVRMRVLMDHQFEIGADYLGGCAYYHPDDFLRDSYFYDMVRFAISEARNYLRKYPLPYQRAA